VIDTSIIVRALLNPRGTVWPVLEQLRAGRFTLVYSAPILQELLLVLRRPRMRDRYEIDEDTIEGVRRLITERGVEVTPTRAIRVCRDPRDDIFLEAAVAGDADVIASGDEDLLVLHPFEGIPIVRLGTFLAMLNAGADA
jgi:uncharacterized protein